MKLQSAQASRLKQGNELADFVRIKPINERNLFNDNKVGQMLQSDIPKASYGVTRKEKLSQRAEELKHPKEVQPIETQKPPSQHSVQSKLSEKPISQPIEEQPRATYSKNEKRFFGVSSHSSKAPESRRSEVQSKRSSQKGKEVNVPQANYEQE